MVLGHSWNFSVVGEFTGLCLRAQVLDLETGQVPLAIVIPPKKPKRCPKTVEPGVQVACREDGSVAEIPGLAEAIRAGRMKNQARVLTAFAPGN
jgi:hypothetical protein